MKLRSIAISLMLICATFTPAFAKKNTHQTETKVSRIQPLSYENKSEEQILAEQQQLMTDLLDCGREQANKILFSIQQMQLVIGNNQLQLSKKTTEKIIQEFGGIFQIIVQATSAAFATTDPQSIMHGIIINHAIAQYFLITPTKKVSFAGFETYIQTEMQALQTSITSEAEFIAFVNKTNSLVDKLTDHADGLGLTRTNKFFRWFFDAPAIKFSKISDVFSDATPYGILKWTVKWSIFATIALYSITYATDLGPKKLKEKLGRSIRQRTLDDLRERNKLEKKHIEKQIALQEKAEQEQMQAKNSQSSVPATNYDAYSTPFSTSAKTKVDESFQGSDLALKADMRAVHEVGKTKLEKFENNLDLMGIKFTLSPAINIPILSALWFNDFLLEYGPIPVNVSKKIEEFKKVGWVQKLLLKKENFFHKLKGNHSTQITSAQAGGFPMDVADVSMDEIIGRPDLLQLAKEIKDYITHPDRYDRTNTPPSTGILLVGPPQTGKSFFAKALRTYLNQGLDKNEIKFISLTKGDIAAAGGIDMVFRHAKALAPCVLFLDEIDMLGANRVKDPITTSDLLTAMSGLDAQSNSNKVVVIAATNMPDQLDFALTKDGRFGKQIPFEYPSYENRVEALVRGFNMRHISIINMTPEETMTFIHQIARQTAGVSFNNLETIIKAALRAAMSETRMVTRADFEQAIDLEIRKITYSANISQAEEMLVAMYQTGKAIAYELLASNDIVVKVTTYPVRKDINAVQTNMVIGNQKDNDENNKHVANEIIQIVTKQGSVFTCSTNNSESFLNDDEYINECLIALAGKASLELITGKMYNQFYKEDHAQAIRVLERKISQGTKVTPKIQRQALAEKDILYEKVKVILEPYKQIIQEIAQELAKKHILNELEWKTLLEKAGFKKP